MFRRDATIEIKSAAQFDTMREAGLVVGRTLALLRDEVAAGMTTADLDGIAEDSIRAAGAVPSFQGYHGFPATICASVNSEVVHGIPGPRVLEPGDIVSLDCGAIVDGWHGDGAVTVVVGTADPVLLELLRVCEEAMWHGLAAARIGARLSNVSWSVESYVRSQGDYGIVEDYVGHGIGTQMHQEPPVANYGRPGRGPRLVRGMALAIEPMVNLGARHTRLLDDGWTVVTSDGLPSAHFEHTVALTEEGPWVLTALDGGRTKLESLGTGSASPGR